MPYPAETYVNQIADPATRAEFMQLYALFQGYLSQQHKDTGAHAAVTADSVSATGAITSGADISANGLITADADGLPVAIGPIAGLPTVSIKNGTATTDSWWRIFVQSPGGISRVLRFQDVLSGGDAWAFEFVKRASGGTYATNYQLLANTSGGSVGLSVGSSAQPIDELYANTINGGETGTWTPTLTFGGGSTGITYGTRTGTYSKLGNVVTVEMRLALTSKGSSTGAVAISGLPYSAALFPSVLIDFGAGGVGLGSTPYAAISGTSLFPLHISGGVRTQLNDTNFSGTDDLRFGISYRV